jgi:hydroxylamine reductase (hybrid-cluster protein)
MPIFVKNAEGLGNPASSTPNSIERADKDMERIHRKSVLNRTSELILAAHERGEGLLWERYEKQLPLCAFTSNGLNCRKCFQGPCRVSPFGDEPTRGVCGADRDQIVMENLFRTTLEGVLETARSAALMDKGDVEIPDVSPDLSPKLRKGLSGLGMLPVSKGQLFGLQNSFFSHREYLSDTLSDLVRMGLIHYGLLKAGKVAAGKAPAAAVSGEARIFCVGQPPAAFAAALKKAAGSEKVAFLGQAGNGIPSIAVLADQGTPEFALEMGMDALVVAPNSAFPALEALAAKGGLPVIVLNGKKSLKEAAAETIRQALAHRKATGGARAALDIRTEIADLAGKEKALQKAFAAGRVKGVVVLFGEANVKQPFFERTLAILEGCLQERCLVLLGGEISAHTGLLMAELARRKSDPSMEFAALLKRDGLPAVASFGSAFEIPGIVSFVRALGAGKEAAELPVVFAFPEFYRASTWAAAASLLGLGFTVQIGTRLPFWGAPSLTESLLKDWPKMTGATLLASPSLPEPAALVEELLTVIRSRRTR